MPEDLFPKAKHVITEINRVKLASNVLKNNDLNAFGALLKESHRSLSEDFEVSCVELDYLAEQSWEMPGVLGSRMMGGGFGGCTINLISNAYLDKFQSEIYTKFKSKFQIEADFIPVALSQGARILA